MIMNPQWRWLTCAALSLVLASCGDSDSDGGGGTSISDGGTSTSDGGKSASDGGLTADGGSTEGCASENPSSPDGPDPWGGCWPGPSNTGIPEGTTLTPYAGPCEIQTAGTVIDAVTVDCILNIRAADVKITRSQINGGVNVPSNAPSNASFTITDSNIHIGDNLNTGLMRRNFHANRVEITGGRRSAYCAKDCVIENSWAHAQGGDPGGKAHFSGIRMEQGLTARHNSITCEAERGPGTGCSAGLTGYGDFAAVQGNLIERNIFYRGDGGGSTICAYGGSSGADGSKPYGHLAERIRFLSNRFVRSETGHCGNLGTILHFDPTKTGNEWTDNRFLSLDGAADGDVVATGP